MLTKNHVELDDLQRMKQAQEDEVMEELEKLGLPFVHPEFQLVVAKYTSRGKVHVDKMMKELLKQKKEEKKSESIDFGKELFKKLCLVRSNKELHGEYRSAVVSKDEELNGHISRREFQKTVDRYLNLTDEESALLAENSGFVDGTHKNDIDYTFVLKLLAEPLERSVFTPKQCVKQRTRKKGGSNCGTSTEEHRLP